MFYTAMMQPCQAANSDFPLILTPKLSLFPSPRSLVAVLALPDETVMFLFRILRLMPSLLCKLFWTSYCYQIMQLILMVKCGNLKFVLKNSKSLKTDFLFDQGIQKLHQGTNFCPPVFPLLVCNVQCNKMKLFHRQSHSRLLFPPPWIHNQK